MARRARFVGFEREKTTAGSPATVEVSQPKGRRHGHGLGLRPSRYVGRHRVEESNSHGPDITERPDRAERRKAKKANDYGFGS